MKLSGSKSEVPGRARTTTVQPNETEESEVAAADEDRGKRVFSVARTERSTRRDGDGRAESISLGNSNLHLFYYIIIPTRRSISGALKRRFSNRSAWNRGCSLCPPHKSAPGKTRIEG